MILLCSLRYIKEKELVRVETCRSLREDVYWKNVVIAIGVAIEGRRLVL